MIKLEHVVLASPEQIAFIIEGMRNPMNSWEKGDSSCGTATRDTNVQWNDDYFIGTNDAYLMQHCSYNQTRNVMMNYEVLANIYKSRKDHKLDEWRNFCEWIEELPYSELITGGVE